MRAIRIPRPATTATEIPPTITPLLTPVDVVVGVAAELEIEWFDLPAAVTTEVVVIAPPSLF